MSAHAEVVQDGVEIVPFEAAHLAKVKLPAGPLPDAEKHAEVLGKEFSISVLEGEEVFAVAGIANIWASRAHVWFMFSVDSKPRHKVALARALRTAIDDRPERRIEATAPFESDSSKDFLKSLGMLLEVPRMVAYRPDGGDETQFVKVKNG